MTIHQWIFVGILAVIALVALWVFASLLGQFIGTGALGALLTLIVGVVWRFGPWALFGYGIWAFFIDGRAPA